jgi:hypothetical protein
MVLSKPKEHWPIIHLQISASSKKSNPSQQRISCGNPHPQNGKLSASGITEPKP